MPVMRTLCGDRFTGFFIWAIAMDLLDKHSKKLFAIPVLTFLLCESLIIVAVPSGPMHQWLYYTMRQVFPLSLWDCISFGRLIRVQRLS